MKNPFTLLKAAFFGLVQGLSAHADTGLIGKPLSVVEKKSDLFVFFNFSPIETKQAKGQTVTFFKPTGEAFRPLVTLEVTTDPGDAIQILRLLVARSFIDDPKKTIYAADLVKSFLGNAAPASADDPVAKLAREISARAMAGSTVTMLTAGPTPQTPSEISPAYQTYAGRGPAQTVTNASGSVQVSLRNQSLENTAILELVMSAKH